MVPDPVHHVAALGVRTAGVGYFLFRRSQIVVPRGAGNLAVVSGPVDASVSLERGGDGLFAPCAARDARTQATVRGGVQNQAVEGLGPEDDLDHGDEHGCGGEGGGNEAVGGCEGEGDHRNPSVSCARDPSSASIRRWSPRGLGSRVIIGRLGTCG